MQLAELIQCKINHSQPFGQMDALRPSAEQVRCIQSEVDSTPYCRFFRGEVSPEPHIFNRRAGWFPQKTIPPEDPCCSLAKPLDWCFATSCNTVFTYKEEDGKCEKQSCIVIPP